MDTNRERLFMLSAYDLALNRVDLTLKMEDEDGTSHKIVFSRLRTNGIMIDIDKKRQLVSIYDFVDACNKDYESFPWYLKKAVNKALKFQQTL